MYVDVAQGERRPASRTLHLLRDSTCSEPRPPLSDRTATGRHCRRLRDLRGRHSVATARKQRPTLKLVHTRPPARSAIPRGGRTRCIA